MYVQKPAFNLENIQETWVILIDQKSFLYLNTMNGYRDCSD